MIIADPGDVERAVEVGILEVGDGVVIEAGVEIGHPTMSGEQRPVRLGTGTRIRSGTVLYSGVGFGERSATGHHVVVRENTTVGDRSILGTGVKCEMDATIGSHVLIETQSHITAFTRIEDYVFFGVGVITTNDVRMLHRRAGAGAFLEGPVVRRGARVGSGALLLPGVEIGEEAVVAAGTLVFRSVPARTLAAGQPMRFLGPAPDDEPIIEGG